MGNRLHVCKTYKVEYGDGLFNYEADLVDTLLYDYIESWKIWNSEDGSIYEIPFEDFKFFLDKFKENKESELQRFEKIFSTDDFYEKWENKDYNKVYQDFVDGFQEMYDQADKSNDFIRLVWF